MLLRTEGPIIISLRSFFGQGINIGNVATCEIRFKHDTFYWYPYHAEENQVQHLKENGSITPS
jgi:hypothetical protein